MGSYFWYFLFTFRCDRVKDHFQFFKTYASRSFHRLVSTCSPLYAQHTLRSLCTLKIPCPYKNTHIMNNISIKIMFVAAPGGKGRIKNCSSDAWWKMWEHAVMLTWMIFLVPFCPKDSSHTVCVLTKLTEESVTRYLCEQHARREWIQLVQCLWVRRYSVPTCTARVIEIFHKRKVSGSSRT